MNEPAATTVTTTDAPAARDISSIAFWRLNSDARADTWASLRRDDPVSLCRPPEATMIPGRPYWAVTRHADVHHVSRHADIFCSGEGVGLADIPVEFLELNSSFLVMDAPRHTAVRRIVSGAFTPRRVAQLDAQITDAAKGFVDAFVGRFDRASDDRSAPIDVVAHLSQRLPLWTISTMMGVPEAVRGDLHDAAESMIALQDPEFVSSIDEAFSLGMDAAGRLHAIAGDAIARRRSAPSDDVLSALVHAEVDGEPLTDQQLGAIFVLFAVAGNDTTRNATSHGIRQFARHPEQWELLRSNPSLIGTAVEEIVRCATPVIHFRRTATRDTVLGDAEIAAGDPVVMFYESANRDEAVFDLPEGFDITRDPNPHVAFGGGGPHFCLGANLARVELRATFEALVQRVRRFEVGPIDYLTSNFVNGIKRMPVMLHVDPS